MFELLRNDLYARSGQSPSGKKTAETAPFLTVTDANGKPGGGNNWAFWCIIDSQVEELVTSEGSNYKWDSKAEHQCGCVVYEKSFGHFKVFPPRWTTGVRVVSSKRREINYWWSFPAIEKWWYPGDYGGQTKSCSCGTRSVAPQNSNKPDTKVPADSTRNPQDNLVGDLRLSLPLFTTWWSHTHTDQKLITWCFHKNELKLLMISLAIHFPSNLSHSVWWRVDFSDLVWGASEGFFCQQSHTPAIIIIRKSFISPITTDIIIFIFLPHLVMRSGGDKTGSLTFSTQHILSIRSGRSQSLVDKVDQSQQGWAEIHFRSGGIIGKLLSFSLSVLKTRELHTQSD